MGAKPLIISQRQVTAILKGAAAAGVFYEMRIEGETVRFVPCEKPLAGAGPNPPRDKRTRLHL